MINNNSKKDIGYALYFKTVKLLISLKDSLFDKILTARNEFGFYVGNIN